MPSARLLSCLAALPLLLALPSCKPSVKSLRNISLDPRFVLHADKTAPITAEARACVEHYLQTGDARYATSTHGITLLQLAAMTHRLWLVEQLLTEGADPNARLRQGEALAPGDTPAMLAVRMGSSNQDALLIVRALVAAGADINIPGHSGKSILSVCLNDPSDSSPLKSGENLALELIKLGARGNTDAATHFVVEAWPKALAELLNSPAREEICRNIEHLLRMSAFCFDGDEDELACATLVLEEAEDVNARSQQENTPLYLVIHGITPDSLKPEENLQRHVDFILALLEKGANPYLPGGKFGYSCAADYLQQQPKIAEALAEQGHIIPAPLHEFNADTLVEQLLDIPTAAVEYNEARSQFDVIATLFTAPTTGMLAHGIDYRRACAKALTLLQRGDTARAEALVADHPVWSDPAAWEGDAHAARGLLHALQENPGFTIPQERLVHIARSMEASGKHALAHALTLLLSRDASAGELIDRLCDEESTPLPIRAAAWSCRVKRAGLPALGEVDAWAGDLYIYPHEELLHAYNADRSAGQYLRPDPAEQPERLFFETKDSPSGDFDAGDEHRVQKALLAVGAPLAAHFRGAGAPKPTALTDELRAYQERHGIVAAASFELEIALARYNLRHAELFRKAVGKYVLNPIDEDEEPEALLYVGE